MERREEREGVGKRKRGGIENQENSKRNQGKGEGGKVMNLTEWVVRSSQELQVFSFLSPKYERVNIVPICLTGIMTKTVF